MKFRFHSAESAEPPHWSSAKLATLGRTGIGFALCTGSAVAIAITLRHVRVAETLPFVFLLIVGIVAHRYGTASAILGLLGGGCVFATCLFPPIGSWSISNEAARTNVVMMLLFGLAVAYFYGRQTPTTTPMTRRADWREGSNCTRSS